MQRKESFRNTKRLIENEYRNHSARIIYMPIVYPTSKRVLEMMFKKKKKKNTAFFKENFIL